MKTEVKLHLEKTLTGIEALLTRAIDRVEALKPGERIPATKLADELAAEKGMTRAQVYPVLAILFNGYPGVVRKAGKTGGIERLPLDNAPVNDDGNDTA